MPHHLNYTIHIKGNKTEFREIKVIIRQQNQIQMNTFFKRERSTHNGKNIYHPDRNKTLLRK